MCRRSCAASLSNASVFVEQLLLSGSRKCNEKDGATDYSPILKPLGALRDVRLWYGHR